MKEANKNRLAWIDAARGLAILLVLLVHATEASYTMNLEFIPTLSLQSQVAAFSGFTAGRLGVPIFLLISGYLLLDRPYSSEQCVKFWKTKWLNLLVVTELWNVIYFVFLVLYSHKSYTLLDIILQLLFLQASDMTHVWYMPMILGWYVLVPFVANALQHTEKSPLLFPACILFGYGFAVPVLHVLVSAFTGTGLTITFLPGLYEGAFYGLYLILGYLVKRGTFRNIKIGWLALGGVLSFASTVWLQVFAYSHAYPYNVRYNCGLLALCALCMFELLSRAQEMTSLVFVRGLSHYSFAIYLTHNIFRTILRTKMSWIPSYPLRVVYLWAATLVLAWLLSWLISKIPKLGKRLLYMK